LNEIESHVLGNFRVWWNLSGRTLITSICQINFQPRGLGSQKKILRLTS
jgi:hypothetical protein